jgi:hypothetical protein
MRLVRGRGETPRYRKIGSERVRQKSENQASALGKRRAMQQEDEGANGEKRARAETMSSDAGRLGQPYEDQ